MTIKSGLCLLSLMLFTLPLQAQPTRDRVLGDVVLNEQPESVSLNVSFNFPVRYLSHFPAEHGRELRIKLSPIAIAAVDRGALLHRESYTPEMPNLAGITEVLYEGDTFSGLYLTLYFLGNAQWQVERVGDYRSLQVRILAPFPVATGEVKGE